VASSATTAEETQRAERNGERRAESDGRTDGRLEWPSMCTEVSQLTSNFAAIIDVDAYTTTTTMRTVQVVVAGVLQRPVSLCAACACVV